MKRDSGWPECPIPKSDCENILLAHGSGGRMMHQLIDRIFVEAFGTAELREAHDGAVLQPGSKRIAFTTDSYVVDPIFFPGGDIGTLAVNGTVNDLAMCGARPMYLSTGFIIEEGLAVEDLWRVAKSMRDSADSAGIRIVTGDTKVVERGKCDKLFINSAGVGVVEHDLDIGPSSIRTGDKIIINGDIGRHGIAVMSEREGLSFQSDIESDCAPLAKAVLRMLDAGIEVHCLRDLTRGGLATSLVEISQTSGYNLRLNESSIPVRDDVRGACEFLGLDPMYVANEGRFVTFVPGDNSDEAMEIINSESPDTSSSVIGSVGEKSGALVLIQSIIGAERIVEMLSGEQLPRIC